MRVMNHRTDGEIGSIFNHNVSNAVGYVPSELLAQLIHEKKDCAYCEGENVRFADLTEDEVAFLLGLYKYSGRVLATSNPGDIVQIHPSLKENLDWIARHYLRVGISHASTSDIIWDDDFEMFKQFPEHDISVFFFGKRANSARPDSNWFSVTEFMNSKNNFIEICDVLGVPCPKTWRYRSKVDFSDIKDLNYPVFLKIDVAVAGLGVIRCENASELFHSIELLDEGIGFQIQREIQDAKFINIQYRINEAGICEPYYVTEQLLEGFGHAGNVFPTKFNPRHITDPLANWMHKKGMKGVFAFDVAVTPQGKYYAIECNPRYNGATYPSNIASKLGLKFWMAKDFKTRAKKLDEIDLKSLEYNPGTQKGVIVSNWGCVCDNKLRIVVAGTPEEQAEIAKNLKKVLLS